MNKSFIVLSATLLLSSAVAFAGNGAKKWKEKHPRRAEVNGRLKNQDERIKDGVKDGQLSKEEAAKLHKEDRNIRKEERRMAAKDGGHITKAEKAKLNRQENRVSGRIHEERHDGDKGQAPAAPAAPANGQ